MCSLSASLVYSVYMNSPRLIACEVDIPFTPSLGNYQQSTKVEHQDQHNIVTGMTPFP